VPCIRAEKGRGLDVRLREPQAVGGAGLPTISLSLAADAVNGPYAGLHVVTYLHGFPSKRSQTTFLLWGWGGYEGGRQHQVWQRVTRRTSVGGRWPEDIQVAG
jgi:hypothetical protein